MNRTPGINIAVVDSGINPAHSHVGRIEGGVSLIVDSEGGIVRGGDFGDEIGHGTAIAGVIKWKAPTARLHAVRIFRRELRASAALLAAALEWAVDEDMKVIHLSLGIDPGEDADALAAICRLARDKGITIVASARSPADNILPASLDSVIGVCRNDDCDEESLIYYPESPIEFGAHGMPRPLPGVPTEMNYSGHSFAAAHVTARVARLLEENPDATTEWVRKELTRSAGTARKA